MQPYLQATDPIVGDVKSLMHQGFQLPRGIRNANPGNIRPDKRNVWRGQMGKDEDNYLIFETPLHGIRAMTIIIVDYIQYHKLTTLHQVFQRWSGDGPLIQKAYAQFVAEACGVQIDDEIDFEAENLCCIKAMIAYENGATFNGKTVRTYYEDNYIRKAIGLSHER